MTSFEDFWNTYAIKRDRIAAERAWKRLSAKDKKAAFDGIAIYREDCLSRGIRMMYAQGYINHRRWEDEREDISSSCSDISPCLPFDKKDDSALVAARKALDAFKADIYAKVPVKPMRWDDYIQTVIRPLGIARVDDDGMIHLCLERESGNERITDYMVDYYDSYSDFLAIIRRHFDIRKLTFDL